MSKDDRRAGAGAGAPSRAPIIVGCAGLTLTTQEKELFSTLRPVGFILFQRNCDNPAQVKNLLDSLRALNSQALLLVDQEGGKVARLTPPHWQAHPAAAEYGTLYQDSPEAALAAAYEGAKKIATELKAVGFNINCFPVLDVPVAGADEVIGTRAYSLDPLAVAALGKAAVEGLKAGGILPVIKHLPGHGRALLDSHKAMPRIATSRAELERTDFHPFRALHTELLGMTAHIVYEALDASAPATLSKRIIKEIVRDALGFGGLLLSDDINMSALAGDLPTRAVKALDSGCDIVLHCSGKLDEMLLLAQSLPSMRKDSLVRLSKVLGAINDAPTPRND